MFGWVKFVAFPDIAVNSDYPLTLYGMIQTVLLVRMVSLMLMPAGGWGAGGQDFEDIVRFGDDGDAIRMLAELQVQLQITGPLFADEAPPLLLMRLCSSKVVAGPS